MVCGVQIKNGLGFGQFGCAYPAPRGTLPVTAKIAAWIADD